MTTRETGGGGIGVFGVLGIVFVTLKLCDVIDWSWWWVLAPFWLGFALFLLAFSILVLLALRRGRDSRGNHITNSRRNW